MLFEQFEEKGLAHYSYAVGCPGAGRIAIVDPKRDVDDYLEFAKARKVAISYVLETHIHADFASGARELAHRTGARLPLSGYDRGELFEVGFPHQDLREGDSIQIGSVRLEPIHTPGHTPEHLSFLVFDESRSSVVPMLMLSGDFLFVGSLGRPDLLGEDAKIGLANRMFDSVQELAKLPDGLEIYPAHGAGSMCGAGMSGRPTSTLGFERMANPYLKARSRQDFVRELLENVPPFPDYYRRMKRLNSDGPPILEGLPGLKGLDADSFRRLVQSDHQVIDLRDQQSFGGAHIPGAFGIGFGTSLSTWAAWVVSYNRPILLVPENREQVEASVRALIRVGLDKVAGYLDGGMTAWKEAGYELNQTPQLSAAQLHERMKSGAQIHVLDVRTETEWRSGHVEGAQHIMAGHLRDQIDLLPKDREIAVICASGYRSTVAASILERASFDKVRNVTGGIGAWKRAGFPVVASPLE